MVRSLFRIALLLSLGLFLAGAALPIPLPVRLPPWPLTTLEARLVHAGTPAPVERLRVRLLAGADAVGSPGRRAPPSLQVGCPVVEGRVKGCVIPRGRWDLRFVAEGFAPRTYRDFRAGSRPLALGVVELERGGTFGGRVVMKADPVDLARPADPAQPVDTRSIRIAVSPRFEETALVTAILERVIRNRTIDPDGRFELVGLPAGKYVVEVAQEGFAPARAEVEVASGGWAGIVEPLALEPVRRLRVEVRPAVDALGRPWTLRLHRYEGDGASLREVATGETGPDGFWRSPPLGAARYTLQVVDFQEGSFAWREVDLVRSGPAEELVAVELSLVTVEGRVLLAGEPLAANLSFQRVGEGRGESADVDAESDEDGEFFLVLPGPGEWSVSVRADDPTVWARDLEVEIEPRGEERIARLTIEVPETRVSGVVVDPQGRPATARVGMTPLEAGGVAAGVITDREGRFELVGVRPGSYLVHAESGDERAGGVLIEVTEGLEPPPLRLVLRSRRALAGVVASDAGPVAGAEVLAVALGVGTTPDFAPSEATSGPDGRFRLPVPQGVGRVLLVTRANGYALDLREVAEGEEVWVRLSRDGGLLRLPRADPGPGEDGKLPVVLVDGVPLDLFMLVRWARTQGSWPGADGSLVVPGMPPGGYARCRLEPWEALMVLTGNARPVTDACSEGLLTAGDELTLEPTE